MTFRAAITKELVFWSILALFAASALPSLACATWYNFSPPGSVDGQGMYRDVLSRCTEAGRQKMYDPDPLTWCHECTHEVNSECRNQIGGNVNAFYVGGGKVCVLPEPRVTISTVASYVEPARRTATFNLYLVQQASGWNQQPLYILDEYAAYINGAQAGKEMGRPRDSDFQHCAEFAYFADCLIAAVKKGDPNYSALADLEELVAHQKARVAAMTGQVAQSCVTCNGGWCPVTPNRVVVRPVQKQSPPTQPTIDTAKLEADILVKLEAKIEAARCKCDHSQDVTMVQVNQAIAEAVANIQIPAPQAPYTQPTPEEQAKAIEPFLSHSATIQLPNGQVKSQTKPLNEPLQFTQHSMGVK